MHLTATREFLEKYQEELKGFRERIADIIKNPINGGAFLLSGEENNGIWRLVEKGRSAIQQNHLYCISDVSQTEEEAEFVMENLFYDLITSGFIDDFNSEEKIPFDEIPGTNRTFDIRRFYLTDRKKRKTHLVEITLFDE